ncbi:MAG: amidohydrolase family protein [Desulfobacteraceae bacterium]|nr:amidohydrolase family protein [Desulfobacteraceae bacterium]
MLIKKQIPLLKDHHTHPSVYAALNNCLDLKYVSNKEDALSLIRQRDEEINVVFGWNNSLYSFEKEELDNLPALLICNLSFHSFLMNESAKEKLCTSYNDIVSNIEDINWIEKNLSNILKLIVNIRPCTDKQITAFYNELLQQGIWYTEEMLLPNKAIFHQFKELGYSERSLFWSDTDTFRSLDKETQKEIYGIKLFADGALGPKTAAIKEPFLTGEKGLLMYSFNELHDIITELSELNKPVAIHAIGDLATEQVVAVLSKIKHAQDNTPSRVRIEHCQFISKTNAEKAKSLGIILSMQPNFSYDSVQYSDRLSETDCSLNNPFRMLIDEVGYTPGNDLFFGSDGMPHGVDYALETSLFPPFPCQKLSLDEFIGGYCMEDMKNGCIDIEINEEKQIVFSNVILKK